MNPSLTVTVHIPSDGNNLTFACASYLTVQEVKQKLVRFIKTPLGHLKVVQDGEDRLDEEKMSDMDEREGRVIHITYCRCLFAIGLLLSLFSLFLQAFLVDSSKLRENLFSFISFKTRFLATKCTPCTSL